MSHLASTYQRSRIPLYVQVANALRRRIEKYMLMEQLIEREMARRHTY
mgnify:CR=1 FL=1